MNLVRYELFTISGFGFERASVHKVQFITKIHLKPGALGLLLTFLLQNRVYRLCFLSIRHLLSKMPKADVFLNDN
ncbi:MAG: hypothetical protein OJF59_000374 [Cytophagales bacterium]|jgi:hypothetical protein|nr:MAG: hypothetical protein OJF59_000374 [Cytophagales bacterium]